MALLCGFQFPAFFLFRLVELRESTNRQRQMAEEEKKAANVGAVWRISKLKGFSYLPLFFPIWQQLKRILSKITSITSFKAYLWSLFDGKLEFIMSDEYRQLKFVDFAYPSFAVGGIVTPEKSCRCKQITGTSQINSALELWKEEVT